MMGCGASAARDREEEEGDSHLDFRLQLIQINFSISSFITDFFLSIEHEINQMSPLILGNSVEYKASF